MPITVKIDTSGIREKFTQEKKSLKHKLKILIFSPYIPVLFFFHHTLLTSLYIFSSKLYLFDIIGFTIKWRVNIDEVYLSFIVFEQMRKDLKIISPKYFIKLSACLVSIDFFFLSGIVFKIQTCGFSFPVKHRASLCFYDIFFRHSFYVKKY